MNLEAIITTPLPVGLPENLRASLQTETREGRDPLEKLRSNLKDLLCFLEHSAGNPTYLTINQQLVNKIHDQYPPVRKGKTARRICKLIRDHRNSLSPLLPKNFSFKLGEQEFTPAMNIFDLASQCKFFQKNLPLMIHNERYYFSTDSADISADALSIINEFLAKGTISQSKKSTVLNEVIIKAHEWQVDELIARLGEVGPTTANNVFILAQHPVYSRLNPDLQKKIVGRMLELLDGDDLQVVLNYATRTNSDFLIDELVKFFLKNLKQNLDRFLSENSKGDAFKKMAAAIRQKGNVSETPKEESPQFPSTGKSEQFLIQALSTFISRKVILDEEFLSSLHAYQLLFLLRLIPDLIKNVKLSPYHYKELSYLIPQFPQHLEGVDARGVTLDSEQLNYLAERCPSLKRLNIKSIHNPHREDPHLNSLSSLEFFNASNSGISSKTVEEVIQACPNLQELKFPVGATDEIVGLLAKCTKHLSSLDVHSASITGEGLRVLACLPITQLRIGNEVQVNEEDETFSNKFQLQDLVRLGRYFDKLQSLSLRNLPNLSEEGIEAMAEALPSLKRIDMSATSDRGCSSTLFDAFLAYCKELRSINISGCKNITESSLVQIAQSDCRRHLKILDISRLVNISDETMQKVFAAEGLSLDSLVIGNEGPSKLTDKTIKAMARTQVQLERLKICGNEFSDQGLSTAISKLPHLKTITFSKRSCLKNDLHLTLKALGEYCPHLKHIKFEYSLIGKDQACWSNFISELGKIESLEKITFMGEMGEAEVDIKMLAISLAKLQTLHIDSLSKSEAKKILGLRPDLNLITHQGLVKSKIRMKKLDELFEVLFGNNESY